MFMWLWPCGNEYYGENKESESKRERGGFWVWSLNR